MAEDSAVKLAWLVLQHADRMSRYGEAHGCDPDNFGASCCLASYCGDTDEVTMARAMLAPLLFPTTERDEPRCHGCSVRAGVHLDGRKVYCNACRRLVGWIKPRTKKAGRVDASED